MANGKFRCDRSHGKGLCGRRDFFRRVAASGLAAAGTAYFSSSANSAAPTAEASASAKPSPLPTITPFGKTITRLVVGGNPLNGYSVPTQALSRDMSDYFTVERTADLFLHCEKVGINTFQGSYSDKVRDGLRLAWERGSKIQWFSLGSDANDNAALDKIFALKPIAVVHHGGVTDRLFREGKSEAIHDFIKKVHDKGLPAGVSSHVPAHIRAVEEKDWGNEFFMTCFYNVVRTEEDLKRDFGGVPLDKLSFWHDDPQAMTAVVRQSHKPCFGFKILGAGRLCWSSQMVEEAFKFAFGNIKPTDGVIVGMYPRFEDEPAMNAALTRKCGGAG
jgi:hypothetical protein